MKGKNVIYRSCFDASPYAESVLREGRIIDEEESPANMVERVVAALAVHEFKFSQDHKKTGVWAQSLGELLDQKAVVFSTPVLTNAGRHPKKPLSACIVPSLNLRENHESLKNQIDLLHQQGMGTGFDLSIYEDPVGILKTLNRIAMDGSRSGQEERPVGNIAVLDVYHPRVLEFIEAKVDSSALQEDWKFNISVDLDKNFISILEADGKITLRNGQTLLASEVFERISSAAAQCADPGIVFLDRMNSRNPIPGLGSYKTTAPCAEVGLIEGEACQFGYLNLAKFLKSSPDSRVAFDYEGLEAATKIITHALDDALEISIENYSSRRSKYIVGQRRKIGIGICGVADTLSLAGYPYDKDYSRRSIRDALLFINYCSKKSSTELAEKRGSCLAMSNRRIDNRYYETPGFLQNLYENVTSETVEPEKWKRLDKRIKFTSMLRNTTTVAIPPTGRSALVIDASTGIEPHFSIDGVNNEVKKALSKHLVRLIGRTSIDQSLAGYEAADLLASAKEISPSGHLLMAGEIQKATDDSVSKTINLPPGTSAITIQALFRDAYRLGMNGASIYIDGTHPLQPKSLSAIKDPKD